MNKHSILKSVSISEMLHMREMGLSNAEIADKIGCSYSTVNRHIGGAPFVKPGIGRKKKGIDALGLPPAGNTPIPEMPRKSFAERLEEAYGKYCEDNGLTNSLESANKFTMIKRDGPIEPVAKIVDVPLSAPFADGEHVNAADLARMSHMQELEKTKVSNDHTHIHELVAVFGEQAVATWLKVSLYDMGIPDCRPMTRQKMLEALKEYKRRARAYD